MKAFLDTSVLIAVFCEDHVDHAASFGLLKQLAKDEVCCAGHSLVEFYSVMTRLPTKARTTAQEAMLLIESIQERITVVSLTTEEYFGILKTVSAQGITGGLIYDAMLAAAGLKSGAGTLYTWNLKHWQQLGKDVSEKLKTP